MNHTHAKTESCPLRMLVFVLFFTALALTVGALAIIWHFGGAR